MVSRKDSGCYCCALSLVLALVLVVILTTVVYQNSLPNSVPCDNFTIGQEYRNGDEYIGLMFAGCPTQTQFDALQEAASTWSEMIASNDISPESLGLLGTTARAACNFLTNNFAIPGNTRFDHLVVIVDITFIDGVGGTLGQAGPCVRDGNGNFPIISGMVLDDADLKLFRDGGGLQNLVNHEMAHTLGFGTDWARNNVIRDPIFSGNSVNVNNVPEFVGNNAVREFDALLRGFQDTVPVEDGRIDGVFETFNPAENPSSGLGSIDLHWKQEVFGSELMVFSLRRSSPILPTSRVTAASLQDLGYDIDLSKADQSFEIETEERTDLKSDDLVFFGADVVNLPVKRLRDL